jgi:hypothetical protein
MCYHKFVGHDMKQSNDIENKEPEVILDEDIATWI